MIQVDDYEHRYYLIYDFVCALTLANAEIKGIAIERGLKPEMETNPRIKRMTDWPPNRDEKGLDSNPNVDHILYLVPILSELVIMYV